MLAVVHDHAGDVAPGLLQLLIGGPDLVTLGKVLTYYKYGGICQMAEYCGIHEDTHGRGVHNHVIIGVGKTCQERDEPLGVKKIARIGNVGLRIQKEHVRNVRRHNGF